jgi:hypothetical protein
LTGERLIELEVYCGQAIPSQPEHNPKTVARAEEVRQQLTVAAAALGLEVRAGRYLEDRLQEKYL